MRTGVQLVYGIFFTNRSFLVLCLAQDTDIRQVHHLDSVSGHCGGATCGRSVPVSW
jgi:hypothetical protein